MDFEYPEAVRMIRDTVKRFMDEEVIPLEKQYHDDHLPKEVAQELMGKIQAIGMWNLSVPEDYGGGGLGALDMYPIREELGKSILGAGHASGNLFSARVPAQLYGASESVKERYLYPALRGEKTTFFAQSEAGSSGSDPASMETTAVRDGDDWVINGSKFWISYAHEADFGVVFAVTDKEKRNRGGITAFLVDRDTPGWRVVRRIDTLGGPGRRPNELVFEDCRVPHEQVLGEVGQGFVIAQKTLNRNRLGMGPGSVGKAERALKMGVAYSEQRRTFGELLADRQAVQWMLVDSAIEIHATRWMSLHAAWRADQGEDIRMEASMVKVFATEMLWKVVDRMIQIHGGVGFTTDLPLESMLRNARGNRIVEGPSEVHRMAIARHLRKGAWF